MTEDEAKTKWCPMARVVVGTISESMAACNRSIQGMPPDLEAQTRCIASACMMWRPIDIGRGGYCGLAAGDPAHWISSGK